MNHWEVRSALCSIEKKGHIFRKLNTGDGDYDNCGIVDGGDAEFHIVLCSLGQSVREWMGWSSVGIRESLGGQYLSSPDPFLFIRRGKNAIWSRKGKRFANGNVEKSQNSPNFVCDQ